jgi:hypothetical protein
MSMSGQERRAPPPFSRSENVATAERRSMAATAPARSTPLLLPAASTTMSALDAMRQEPTGESSPTGCGGGGAAAARATSSHSSVAGGSVALTPSYQIYQNQVDSAKQILYKFSEGFSHGVLEAPTMSGKTGIFLLVGCEMLRQGIVEKVVIYSANNEKDLAKQAEDSKQRFKGPYIKYLRDEQAAQRKDQYDFCAEMDSIFERLKVTWGHCKMGKLVPSEQKTLFIQDESHVAQKNHQSVSKFHEKQGLCVHGGKNTNGHLMLSVSATAFSELRAVEIQEKKKLATKFVVRHDTSGTTYRGFKEMYDEGQIQFYEEGVREEEFEKLVNRLRQNSESDSTTRRVGLVRARGSAAWRDSIVRICKDVGVELLHFDAKYTAQFPDGDEKKDINWQLKNFKGVIILQGLVTMGKELVNRNRICWWFVSSYGGTDTTLQCRSCSGGYSQTEDYDVWLPAAAKDDLQCVRDTGISQKSMCVKPTPKGKNVDPGNLQRLYKAIPLRLELPFETARFEVTRGVVIKMVREKLLREDTRRDYPNEYRDNLLAKEPATFIFNTKSAGKDHDKEHVEQLCSHARDEKVYNSPGASHGLTPGKINLWVLGAKYTQLGKVFVFDDEKSCSSLSVIVDSASTSPHESDPTNGPTLAKECIHNENSSNTSVPASQTFVVDDNVSKKSGKDKGKKGTVVEVFPDGKVRVKKKDGDDTWSKQRAANFQPDD